MKRALELLRSERLIVSRQGSGAHVRAQTPRPVELRPHIETAFERAHVSIDFAGFSGKTLRNALFDVLDKVRAGQLAPETIAVRVMLSDMSTPMALPGLAETRADDPRVRERVERIMRRAAESIIDQVRELGDLGLVRSGTAEVRLHGAARRLAWLAVRGCVPSVVRLTVEHDRAAVRAVSTSTDLAWLLAGGGPILLDFDGPIRNIFAGYPAPVVAAELRQLLIEQVVELPQPLSEQHDPLEVLRRGGHTGPPRAGAHD